MKHMTHRLFLLIPLFVSMGCEPDLTVKSLDVTWDGVSQKAAALIQNIGKGYAGQFMVYFNAEENPVSMNDRPQVSLTVDSLAPGASISLGADFHPLASMNNSYLGNVYKIVVVADPKDMVKESNENNNEMEQAVPIVDQSNLVPQGYYSVDSTHFVTQTFIVSQTSLLVGIEVSATRGTALVSDVLTFEVGQGSVTFGSFSIPGIRIPSEPPILPPPLNRSVYGPGYVDMRSMNKTLISGETYFFKLTNASIGYFNVGITPDLYPEGEATLIGGVSPGFDLVFKIVVLR
jgi:hypothetical protein